MAEVRIRLLDPEMLGRRFQYAFLSFAENIKVRPDLGIAVFVSEQDYVETVKTVMESIIRGLTWPEQTRRRSKCSPLVLMDYGINCSSLDKGPNLYRAGLKSDYRTIRDAGLVICKAQTKECKETVAWTHAAISYAISVVKKGGPIGGDPRFDIPWLARATLFSKIRSVQGTFEARKKRIDPDTLGTVLLGGAISFLGTRKLADQSVEFYILPDYVSKAYRVLREIMAMDGITGNLAAKTAYMLSDGLSVSFEQALALAVASMVRKHAKVAQEAGVSLDEALASGKLYTIQPSGQRPQVRAGIPLTNVLLQSYEDDTIKAIDWVVNEAVSQRDRDAKRAATGAASTCLNSLFLQAMAGAEGDLYLRDCARDLASAYSYEKVTNGFRDAAGYLLWRLEVESRRILSSAVRRGS